MKYKTDRVGVEGQTFLKKDLLSNGCINTNKAEIEAARKRKQLRLEEKQKKEALENEVVELRSQLAELTQLVKDMVK